MRDYGQPELAHEKEETNSFIIESKDSESGIF